MGIFFTDDEMDRLTRAHNIAPDGFPNGTPAWVRGDMPLYIFGTGQAGQDCLWKLAKILPDKGRLAGFLDNNPALAGGRVAGLPVQPPAFPHENGEKPVVLVASYNPGHRHQMFRDCARFGYPAVLAIWLDMFIFKNTRPPRYFEEHPGALAALDIWADTASRRVYTSMIRARASREVDDVPRPADGPIYFDPRVPLRHYRSFVDGGAFDGDTFPLFVEHTRNDFDAYHAFEPGPESFRKLAARIGHDDRARLHNAALLDRQGEAAFRNDEWHAPGSLVDPDAAGGVRTAVTTLDAALAGRAVTMIKLDIEGAEPAALAGARATIGGQRPALAVCVYHEPEHLWEIPLWIKSLDLGYRFFCAQHADTISETVCYAVPT